MEIDQDVKADLQVRLRRIEGQVRGIQAMIADDRECRDIVTQIAAASKAIEQVGFRMLASGMASCLQDPDKAEVEVRRVARQGSLRCRPDCVHHLRAPLRDRLLRHLAGLRPLILAAASAVRACVLQRRRRMILAHSWNTDESCRIFTELRQRSEGGEGPPWASNALDSSTEARRGSTSLKPDAMALQILIRLAWRGVGETHSTAVLGTLGRLPRA